ncbi:hypothetical protein DL93DRAFT_2144320 [Clavulina sp. PMI_390]|nr:hypothetical protein DL93DRAFT_2144320 [Clavulina sp. PMI_390]
MLSTTAQAASINSSASSAPAPAYSTTAAPGSAVPTQEYLDAYSSQAPPPPYPTSLPDTFPIGGRKYAPVVAVSDLQWHLRILGAFSTLREGVRSEAQAKEMDADAAWATFLARAVDRFARWTGQFRPTTTGSVPPGELPPIDVLMVWHSYMLNPRNYYEDCLRVLQNLLPVKAFPLREAAESIDPITLIPTYPAPERVAAWESRTQLPFAAAFTTTASDVASVRCPMCEGYVVTNVPWITDAGTGFAQKDFLANCMTCKGPFNREAMRVRRLCEDIDRALRSPKDTFLAGTILSPTTGAPTTDLAAQFNKRLLLFVADYVKGDPHPAAMALRFGYKMQPIQKLVKDAFRGTEPPRVKRVFGCYESVYPFSLELAGAVLRQGSFIQKMVDLNWTAHDRFAFNVTSNDPRVNSIHVLVRSIARYHAFLDLMSSTVAFFVPTIDIDLSWHTHQLLTHAYRDQTLQFLRRTPDHDDKVEEGALSSAYDYTARAWKSRFGVPYSVCGCGPLEEGLGDKISKLFTSKSKSAANAQIGPKNPRPDLVSIDDADADATHPSEHNSVVFVPGKGRPSLDYGRRMREAKIAKRHKDMIKAMEKGKYRDEWERMRVQRALQQGRGRANNGRERNIHDAAFLAPIPYWGM